MAGPHGCVVTVFSITDRMLLLMKTGCMITLRVHFTPRVCVPFCGPLSIPQSRLMLIRHKHHYHPPYLSIVPVSREPAAADKAQSIAPSATTLSLEPQLVKACDEPSASADGESEINDESAMRWCRCCCRHTGTVRHLPSCLVDISTAAFGEGVNPICTHVVLRGAAPSVRSNEGKRTRVRLEILPSWFCSSEFVRQLVVLDLTGNRLTTLPHATGKLRCVRYRIGGGGHGNRDNLIVMIVIE